MLYFKIKRFLPYITFSSRLSYSTAYNSYSFCDRSKLFAVLEWSVNCLSETFIFLSKIVIEKVIKRKNLFNKILIILYGVD